MSSLERPSLMSQESRQLARRVAGKEPTFRTNVETTYGPAQITEFTIKAERTEPNLGEKALVRLGLVAVLAAGSYTLVNNFAPDEVIEWGGRQVATHILG